MTNIQRVLSWIAVAVIVVAMTGMWGAGRLHPASIFEQADTTVWYCAGEAVNHHADPYLVEPLRSCEIRNEPSRHQPWVEPAPLPGYALAAFSLLARLPFDVARTGWFYLLIAAIVGTAVLLAKIARVPVPLVVLALAMTDGYFNLFYGELPPLVVGVLVAAGALGASGRFVAAALVGSIAMIEPHLGLPACLAMFVWWPRTRATLIVTGGSLLALSLAALGVGANIEYVTALLPVHAASEIAAQDQYSLTRVLHLFGLPDGQALRAGTLSYIVMTLLGVAAARAVASAVASEALIVLLPPALALLGGPFVHDIQMAAALPAAIILATATRAPLLLRVSTLVMLVFPWHAWNLASMRGQTGLLELGAVAAAAFIATRTKRIQVRALTAAACVCACVVIGSAIEDVPRERVGPPTTITPEARSSADLSSANWAAYVSRDRAYSSPDLRDVLEKVPVWLGLITLTGMGLRLGLTARGRRGDPIRDAALRARFAASSWGSTR
jgi:hypothetical protein